MLLYDSETRWPCPDWLLVSCSLFTSFDLLFPHVFGWPFVLFYSSLLVLQFRCPLLISPVPLSFGISIRRCNHSPGFQQHELPTWVRYPSMLQSTMTREWYCRTQVWLKMVFWGRQFLEKDEFVVKTTTNYDIPNKEYYNLTSQAMIS